jgi:hypothetical protein
MSHAPGEFKSDLRLSSCPGNHEEGFYGAEGELDPTGEKL